MIKSDVVWKNDVFYPISLFSVACMILLLSSFSTKASYESESNIVTEASLAADTFGADDCERTVSQTNGSLVSFSGRYVDDRNLNAISWITSSEAKTDYYILERSIDNGEFQSIAKVDAKGTTSADALYSYNDTDISISRTYLYRLQQVSNDGISVYSNNVSISLRSLHVIEPTVIVFFDSTHDVVNVDIVKGESDVVSVMLFDVTGKVMTLNNVNVVADGNYATAQIEVDHLPKAEYILRINIGDQVFAKKVALIL